MKSCKTTRGGIIIENSKSIKLTNLEKINTLLEQIEALGYHIINKQIGNCYFLFEDDEADTICQFEIKEIKGFLFGLWNTCRYDDIKEQLNAGKITWADYLHVPSNSEFIFFTQFKRNMDKFKPSQSSFVTGLHRLTNDNIKEPKDVLWELSQLEDILLYMKKHKIRSSIYVQFNLQYIWESDISSLRILYIYISDLLMYWKDKFVGFCKLKYLIYKSKHLCKNLKSFLYILEDRGCHWIPRLALDLCRKDDVDINICRKEQLKIAKFEKKFLNDMSIRQWSFNIDDTVIRENYEKDKRLRKHYFEMYNYIKSGDKDIDESDLSEDEKGKIILIYE